MEIIVGNCQHVEWNARSVYSSLLEFQRVGRHSLHTFPNTSEVNNDNKTTSFGQLWTEHISYKRATNFNWKTRCIILLTKLYLFCGWKKITKSETIKQTLSHNSFHRVCAIRYTLMLHKLRLSNVQYITQTAKRGLHDLKTIDKTSENMNCYIIKWRYDVLSHYFNLIIVKHTQLSTVQSIHTFSLY